MALLRDLTTDRIVAKRVVRASSFFSRAIGLLGRSSLDPDEGLWIARCNAVHTLGMRVAIDLIFVDAGGRIVRLEPDVRPNRLALYCGRARTVVELGRGALAAAQVRVGDELALL